MFVPPWEVIEELMNDPQKRAYMESCCDAEMDIVAALAMKTHLCKNLQYDEASIDEAMAAVFGLVNPSTYRGIRAGAMWLGESALSLLKNVYDQKFGYIDALLANVPESLRDLTRSNINRLLSKEVINKNGLKIVEVVYSKHLGVRIVFDLKSGISAVALEHELRKSLDDDYEVRSSLPYSRGVGVRIQLTQERNYDIAPEEVLQHAWWNSKFWIPYMRTSGRTTLPLPLGLADDDSPLIVDLADLNALVGVSADAAGIQEFCWPLLRHLAERRTPQQVNFIYIEGIAVWLPKFQMDYMRGSKGSGISGTSDIKVFSSWCEHALSQLNTFRSELDIRRRLFSANKSDDFDDYNKNVEDENRLAHWICCITALPFDVKPGHPCYDIYCNVSEEIYGLIAENLVQFGLHMIFATFAYDCDSSIKDLIHYRMYRGENVGMAITYGHYKLSMALDIFGSSEAMKVGAGRCVYKNQMGEVWDYCMLKE